MTALVDTSVLYAYANNRDAHHVAAFRMVQAIDPGNRPTSTSPIIFEELFDLTRVHLSQDTAIELLDRLQASAGFEIDHATRSDFDNAERLFRDDRQLSFVDATTVAYMDREGIDICYSFDDDFNPYVARRGSV